MPYHYDPRQSRVPAGQHNGGQWTDGFSNHPIVQRVRGPAPPVRNPIGAALALFTPLLSRKNRDQRPIIVLKAHEYTRHDPDGFDAEDVRLLTQNEVDRICRRLQQGQIITDDANNKARPLRSMMSPTQYGTLVHSLIKDEIDVMGDPNLRAEISHIKGIEDAQDYGSKGSVRVDVLERRDKETVCVYDIKTGRSGLSASRFREIASSVFSAYGPVQRIIITEVRPTP